MQAMDGRLESEIVKRCRLFEDLEDSLRIRQDVLDKIQLDIEGRVDCIKDLNEKSRKIDLENTDLEFRSKKKLHVNLMLYAKSLAL